MANSFPMILYQIPPCIMLILSLLLKAKALEELNFHCRSDACKQPPLPAYKINDTILGIGLTGSKFEPKSCWTEYGIPSFGTSAHFLRVKTRRAHAS